MATLKDVARESGLTVSTVSRVLNNRGYISDDARRKVAEAMKKLNYRPNEVARSLQNKKSNTIGLLVPHIQHPYFSEMISHLENEAYNKGYKVFLFNTRGREDMTREYVEMCNASRVDGIILCSGNLPADTMDSLAVPVVAIERPISGCAASVACNNVNGGYLATQALIDAGCRHLLFIGNVQDVSMPADDRATGFEEICTKNGIQYSIVHTGQDVYNNLDYYQYIDSFLDSHELIDGIFCSSDIMAAQVLQLCKARGIRVPEDMKVIGFDDVNVASLTSPQLTTIHQPIEEMSRTAIDLLVRAIGGEKELGSVVFPVQLIQRESV